MSRIRVMAERRSTRVDDAEHATVRMASPRRRGPRCPTCRQPIAWDDNPQRPFCSLSCRLIDLGVWLDERYVVRGDPPADVR
jgi:endogenous inhibitor of DNA gyrase (YacG/DUF329 family)